MPVVIIPSENQTREFDAKLLLACCLAEKGFRCIIGARHEIHNRVGEWPRGIYVAKDFRKPSERILKLIDDLGHHIVAWDEEGFVQPIPSLYYERRMTKPALSHVSQAFAWGPANRKLMADAPLWPGIPIHETGNPRLDMLRPELAEFHGHEVKQLLNEYGQFVLFNSNFAAFNPAITSVAPIMKANGSDAHSAYFKHRQELYAQWVKLLPMLAKAIAPKMLIVRPHPAESHQMWRDVLAGSDNAVVVHQGSVIPWIRASAILIHSGCTTGVEAFFMQKRSISLRTTGLEEIESDLPDALSEIACDSDELVRMVQQRLRSQAQVTMSLLQQRLARDCNYAAQGALASDRIADVLEKIANHHAQKNRKISAVLLSRLRQFEKIITSLNPAHKTSRAKNLLRYPGVDFATVENKVALLAKALDRFHGVKVKHLSGEIFEVA